MDLEGITCKKFIVPEKGHSFEIKEEINSDIDRNILAPIADWCYVCCQG